MNKYNKDPFGQSIESKKREKFFTERLNKYGNPIIESLVLTLMDNIHEASEELVGDAHLTSEQLDEYLNDAKMIILHKLHHEISDLKDKADKESILFYWALSSSEYDKL